MNCLLCGKTYDEQMTWGSLLSKKRHTYVCNHCYNLFEKVKDDTYEGVRTLYYYNEAMQNYLFRYKFLKDCLLAYVFADEIKKVIRSYKSHIVVPIPMHPKKRQERTFSHIDEILYAAKVPFVHLLEKTTTAAQSEKTKIERENSARLFKRNTIQLKKETPILLIDDIITTGTTIRHAKEALMADGFTNINVVVLISARF